MICSKCNIEMVIGQAIDPGYEDGCRRMVGHIDLTITDDTLELIDVWKCPNCGHSEIIETNGEE